MSYSTLNFPGATSDSKTLLTGIRINKCKSLMTGFYVGEAGTLSFVLSNGGYYILNYPNAVTNLYGPCILEHSRVRLVGNIVGTNGNLIGCMYTGKLDGTGKWKTLEPGVNTICHSTMGDLIVGNTQEELLSKAFIYDITKKKYTWIKKSGSKSVTAYGIWHNGDSYTICGGYSPLIGLQTDIGYTVEYNSVTGKFSNWRDYYYMNDPTKSTVTHFDGISKGNLTGVAVHDGKEVAFYLNAKKNVWKEVKYPNSSTTTGNSIAGNTIIGVYTINGSEEVNGYTVNI